MMNDIQQLIDRYLAEGLSSDELARLSHAVHRDDAPAEWLVIREMIDTLTEGEEDYDLILAARAKAAQPAAKTKSIIPFLRATWFRNTAAAAIILVAVVGTALYFTNERDPQVAEVKDAYLVPTDSPALSPVASIDKTPVASTGEEPTVSAPEPTVSAAPTAEVPTPRALPARRANHHREIAATPKTADASQQDETQPADMPVDVPERRIYSYNLLNQVSDYYDSPACDDY